MDELKDWVFAARAHAGLTQDELAAQLAMTKGAISAYEKGRNAPSVSVVNKIAQITKYPVPFSRDCEVTELWPAATVLESERLIIEPLGLQHEQGLREAVLDGALWQLVVTSAPEPDKVKQYIEQALQMRAQGNRLAHAIIEKSSGRVLGSSSYHDIIAPVKRVEIGYTWYAKSVQRSHVNTLCKYMLLEHAFEHLDCAVEGGAPIT